jgi:hypothetical protein
MNQKDKETNPVVINEETKMVLITIPDIAIEAAASIAPSGYYAGITEKGIYYKSFDLTVPFVTGRIVGIETYLGRFEGGVLLKMPLSPQPYPEGYRPRMELTIQDPEKTTILSLAPTSVDAAASFFRHLKNSGLRPENILVRISTTARTSKQGGRYGVAVFTIVENMGPNNSTQEPEIVQAVVETVSPAPSAKPANLQNPWA